MTDDLQKHVDQIRSKAPELNEATDAANLAVAKVEKLLNEECSVGLPASAEFSCEDVEPDEVRDGFVKAWRQRHLVYDRIDGRFRIGVEETLDEKPDDCHDPYCQSRESIIPWERCPRAWKLGAICKLPELLATIASEMESAIDKAHEAASAVTKIADAVNGNKK